MATNPLIIECVVLGIISLLTLVGNSLVIVVFSRDKSFLAAYLIINLAVADFLVGALVMPLWIAFRLEYLDSQSVEYKIFHVLDVAVGVESVLSLVLISIERMVLIKYPVRHRLTSKIPCLVAILISWTYSITIGIPQIFFWDSLPYQVFIWISVFLLPILTMVFCYSVIFRGSRRLQASNSCNMKKNLKTVSMILIIIGLFMVTWLPFFIYNVIFFLHSRGGNSHGFPTQLLLPFKVLHYSNSAMNVFVYAVTMPTFRETFKQLAMKYCRKQQTNAFPQRPAAFRESKCTIFGGSISHFSNACFNSTLEMSTTPSEAPVNRDNGI